MKGPSRTAELAALARASLTKEDEPLRGADTLAAAFLPGHLRFVLNVSPLRRLVRAVLASRLPGAYGMLAARSKRFDDFVFRELSNGATQLVVLGAGYDSRAYRFSRELASGRAFEVDAPATSARKQALVRKVLGHLPPHVAYVGVDFEKESLERRLVAAGFDPTAKTVFTWEGVTFYLAPEAVDAVLRFVGLGAPGSAVVFDYLFRSVVDGTSRDPWAKKSVVYVRNKGEPFQCGLDPLAMGAFLSARGLQLEDNLLPSELNRRLGSPTRDVFRVGEFYGIATARVSPPLELPLHEP